MISTSKSFSLFLGTAIFIVVSCIVLWGSTPRCGTSAPPVYNPQRLVIKDACVALTGTIVDATHGKVKNGVRHEQDGDTHGWLHLDAGQERYLNAANTQYQNGNLVFEITCYWTPTQKDAIPACQHYTNTIVLPPVGTHVRVYGTWVQDTNHEQWLEIHPVTTIEILDQHK